MQKRKPKRKQAPLPVLVKFNAIVGNAVSTFRTEAGLTQGELAVKMKVPQSALSRLESGAVPITVDQLKRASWALGMHAHVIMQRAEDTADQLKARGFNIVTRREREGEAGQALGGAALAGILLMLAAGAVGRR